MADKDFAQVETSQFSVEQAYRERSNPKPLVLASLALIGVAVCFATGFYMGEKFGKETSKSNKHMDLVNTLKAQQAELKALKEESKTWRQHEASTSQVGELTFYNELPKQSIVPEFIHAKDAKKHQAISPSSSISNTTHAALDNEKDDIQAVEKKLEHIIQQELNTSSRSFRIQVASFKSRSDAEIFLPKLKEIGVVANIQRVDLPNIGVWYRVYSATFGKEQQAIHAKLSIKEKLNITGIMIQND